MWRVDGGFGAKVFCCAPKLEQADIVYNNIWQMLLLDPEYQALKIELDERDTHNVKVKDQSALPKHRQSDLAIIATNSTVKKIAFSAKGQEDIQKMCSKVMQMLIIAKDAFDNLNKSRLPELAALEDETDAMKKELTSSHFARLAEGGCSMAVSPYYSSTVAGLERVADHLVNVGYSIVNPIGSQE
jgi:phosphate uptake regulator